MCPAGVPEERRSHTIIDPGNDRRSYALAGQRPSDFLGPSRRKGPALTVRGVQKAGQRSRVIQVQTTGRFEVEDFSKSKHIRRLSPP